MDLGLDGKRAIVCASSRGLGRACAEALVREGADVVVNGRNDESLQETAEALRAIGRVNVDTVAGDIGHDETRARILEVCAEPDILVNNNGGPPPGSFANWDRAAWIDAFEANMIAPTLMIQAVLPGMVDRGFGRIVNITSAMVKTPLSPMGLSTAARSALTSLCKALSRDVAAANVTINNLLPERFDTARQRGMAELRAELGGVSLDQAYHEMRQSIAAKRLGRPEELGATCAFLCSQHAGFISGQNIQLDGGSYAGV